MTQRKLSSSLRQQAAAGGKWTAFSAVAGVTIQLAQLAALGRLLEPADFGLMAMMMVVIGLAISLADFGVGNYIVQVGILSRQLFWRLFSLGIGLSLVLSVFIAIVASWVANYYQSPILRELLPWLGLLIVTSTASQIYFSLLQRALRFKVIAVLDILSAAVGMVVSIELAWFGYGVWSLIIGQIAVSAFKTILYIGFSVQVLMEVPVSCSGLVKAAMRFGYFQVGERILNFVGWNLDKVIIGKLLGERDLGIYSVAYQLMMRPFLVLNPIFTRVSLPIFSQIKNDDARLRKGYLEVIRTIALLSFPMYLGLAIAAPAIVEILMGSKWLAAAPVLSILCGLGLLFTLGNPIGTLILAKGRPDWAFYLNLLALVVYVAAFYLGSFFGILGVATAFLLAAGVFLFPVEFYLRWKLVGMTVDEYFVALKHHIAGAVLPLTVLIYFSVAHQMPQSLFYQLLAGFGGASSFMIYLWFTERELIKSTYALVLKRNE
jgi:PST family polysaccharide transporter/lipopolysaccharide exporter